MSDCRITSAEVLEIFPAPSGVTDVSAFISIANVVIDEHLVGEGISDAVLKEIARLLSAHFAEIRYKRTTAETIGPAKEQYQSSTYY